MHRIMKMPTMNLLVGIFSGMRGILKLFRAEGKERRGWGVRREGSKKEREADRKWRKVGSSI